MSVEAILRFRKRTKGHLWLRVYHCTGMANSPREEVIDLGPVDLPKGGRRKIEIARRIVRYPGRTEDQIEGWGESTQDRPSLIGRSNNVAIIELSNTFPSQRYKVFVAAIDYSGGEIRPSLFAFGESQDVWSIDGAKHG